MIYMSTCKFLYGGCPHLSKVWFACLSAFGASRNQSPTFFVLKKPKQRQASKTLIFVQTKAISKREIIEVYQAVAKKDPWSEWDASE